MAREERDVLGALGERGQPQRHDVEAVVEVLAEAAGLLLLREVAVRGGDDAHVEREWSAWRRSGAPRASRSRAGASPAGRAACRRSRRGRACPCRRSTKRPRWSAMAPVNEPFVWPKSSLSSSVSGMAPQLMATKGWFARGLARWMARASSSLPVPLSPWIRTLASLAATRCALASRSSMSEERVTMSSRQAWPAPAAGAAAAVQRERALDLREQLVGVVGLGEVAEHAALHGGHGVGNRPVGGEDDDRQARVATPGSPGRAPCRPCPLMRRSVSTTSGREAAMAASALRPVVDGVHGVAVGLQADREEPEEIRVVVDQQQGGAALRRHGGRGSPSGGGGRDRQHSGGLQGSSRGWSAPRA